VRTVGELKTKVKIVKVPALWSVDQTVRFYESLPGVVYAEPNYVADQHTLAAPNDYYFSQQWGLARIDALDGWNVFPCAHVAVGVPIAIVDTGVDSTHPDLAGQVSAGANCMTGVCTAAGLALDDNATAPSSCR
jgi:thermitase